MHLHEVYRRLTAGVRVAVLVRLQEMYTFQDNSGKSVTLRPEGTAGTVCRNSGGTLCSPLLRSGLAVSLTLPLCVRQ